MSVSMDIENLLKKYGGRLFKYFNFQDVPGDFKDGVKIDLLLLARDLITRREKTKSSQVEEDKKYAEIIDRLFEQKIGLESMYEAFNSENDRKALSDYPKYIWRLDNVIEDWVKRFSNGNVYVVLAYVKGIINSIFIKYLNIIPPKIKNLNIQLKNILAGIKFKIAAKHSGGLILEHEGTIFGDLQPNERLIKLLVGERVLSIEQNKAFEKMLQEGWGGGGEDTYITNNYTYPIDMESFREALARPENREIIKGFNALNIKLTGRSF